MECALLEPDAGWGALSALLGLLPLKPKALPCAVARARRWRWNFEGPLGLELWGAAGAGSGEFLSAARFFGRLWWMQTKEMAFPRWKPGLLAGVCLLASSAWAGAAEYTFDFSSTPLGEQPPGFRSAVTGEGRPGEWKIVLADFPPELGRGTNAASGNRRKVLAQTSQDEADNHFPVLIHEDGVYDDFKFQTRVKMAAGKVEQMAGIAFRIQDEKNYFVLRVSALGNNVAFYPVKEGRISSTPIGLKMEIKPEVWHILGVECDGSRIVCKFDGAQVLDLRDATFAKGRAGFWTKSDSVSYFADASLSYVPRERFAEALAREMKSQYPRILGLKLSAFFGTAPKTFRVVASLDSSEIGKEADPQEKDVISRGTIFYGKGNAEVTVAIPLHDRNGDVIASARFLLKSFPGQTEINAIARALPIAKAMEARILGGRDLLD
jgi:hypothetical protein